MTAAKSRFFILGGLVSVSLAMGMAAPFLPVPKRLPPSRPSPIKARRWRYSRWKRPCIKCRCGIIRGKIAVYSSMEAQTPQYVTDFDTAVLPQQDREMLKEGIGLRNEEELQMLLEDYGS